MRRAGWNGVAHRVISKSRSGAHYMRVVAYVVGDELVPYVELWETHDRARRARIVPLADLVHLVQNVGPDEMKQIAGRKKPS